MQSITVLLLAGHRSKPGPICDAYRTRYKSLVPIAGQPMMLYPLMSLLDHEQISVIIVLAQEPDVLRKGLSNFTISEKVRFCKSNGSIANTILDCIQEHHLSLPIMVTTADNCLLKVEDIDDFLSQAFKSPADLTIGFASKDIVMAAYPEVRRTWIPFMDTEVTGCNLFLLTGDKSGDLIRFWRNFENSPKILLKLAWTLGPAFFWHFLRRQMTLMESFKRLSSITGANVMPVLLKNPEVSIDADKFTDIRQIETILNKEIKTAKHNPVNHLPSRPVVIFDLDRTITTMGTYTPFLVYYALRQNSLRLLFLPVVIIFTVAYILKLLDRKQLKSLMFGLIIGQPDKVDLDRVCTAFVDYMLDKNVYPEALYTIREWQKNDAHLVLATASYDWMANIFAEHLKFDHVIATRSITKDEKIIPGTNGENCYGAAKLRMITAGIGPLITHGANKQDIWFYTDHHSDISVLDACNHPVAVNATRKLGRWIRSRTNGLQLDWRPPARQIAAIPLLSIACIFSLAILIFALGSHATETVNTLTDVPGVVSQAVIQKKPGIVFSQVILGSENNSTYYGLKGTDADKEDVPLHHSIMTVIYPQ